MTSKQKELGQYMTPNWLAEKMTDHIKIPAKDWIVFDPACGTGNLLIAAIEKMKLAGVRDIHKKIGGLDIDKEMASFTRRRLSLELGVLEEEIQVFEDDFMRYSSNNFLIGDSHPFDKYNVVLSNPPYGKLREYSFFRKCNEIFRKNTELLFLIPLSFLDRVKHINFEVIEGSPMDVTTGHAIVHHLSGTSYEILSVKQSISHNSEFFVLSGIKLYEIGAGNPIQDATIVKNKPFSSSDEVQGWIPCVRTGDIQPNRIELGRLWVNYGNHLAHPKELSNFVGPRLFVRRVPIWSTRQLGAVYIEDKILCSGDVLVIRHKSESVKALKSLCAFLNSESAALILQENRPSLRFRSSFPKISAKDIYPLLDITH